jgi:hypothetical protein
MTIELVQSTSDLPAWVQAIGSIVAIYIAARLVRLEALHRAVAAMESFKGVIYATKALVDDAATAAEHNLVGDFRLAEIQSRRFKDVEALLAATPTFELGSTKAAFELLQLKEDVRQLALIKQGWGGQAIPAEKIAVVRLVQQRTAARADLVDKWIKGRRWRRWWWWWLWTPARE